MTNHEKIIISAKEIFLQHDVSALAQRLSLQSDEEKIYINFLGDTYIVHKRTGEVLDSLGAIPSYQTHLIIFDALCRTGLSATLSGRYTPVNSLGNMVHPGVSEDMLYQNISPIFGADIDGYTRACLTLGGVPFPIGDHAFTIKVFDFMPATIQLWEADDEFPASVRLLWDENTLGFFKYETVWYIAELILTKIHTLLSK